MPIPSFARIDHIGLVVPDIDEAIDFFGVALGAEMIFRGARPADPAYMVESLGAPADATYEIAMVRVPPDTQLELFEWTSSERRAAMPSIADADAHHLGVQVTDIDAAFEHLGGIEGVRFLGGIKQVPEGALGAGIRFVYFRTPWGLNMELVDRSRQEPLATAGCC